MKSGEWSRSWGRKKKQGEKEVFLYASILRDSHAKVDLFFRHVRRSAVKWCSRTVLEGLFLHIGAIMVGLQLKRGFIYKN